MLRTVEAEARPATAEEQRTLAAWSSWGAVPGVFDEDKPEWAEARAELRGLLTGQQWSAASRTTINAHYTDPVIVTEMWRALSGLGVGSGNVLEPGCGSGTFIGLAPAGVDTTGVELDPSTAAIASALYPEAAIRAESFADSRFAGASFDAAIGNVPFGNVVLHDRDHNPQGLSMHNHFIVKSLDLVRPGGVAAFLTSSFTMDAASASARREMFGRADLIGAVRLPSGAHRRTAGTEALTDLLVFRRREEGRPAGDDGWLATVPVAIDGTTVRVNEYWAANPGRVLGEMRVGQGMYGAETLRVDGDLAALPEALHSAVTSIISSAEHAGLTATGSAAVPGPVAAAPDVSRTVGTVLETDGGGFTVVTPEGTDELVVPRSQRAELSALLAMRDAARAVLTREAASSDDSEDLVRLRAGLAGRYEAYVGKYGPINRYKRIETKRIDPDTGDPVVQRRKPAVMKFLRTDPWASLVRGLEMFDEVTMQAAPAAILSERVVLPRTPPAHVDTPQEAIAVALDTDGRLELPRVAALLDVPEERARELVGTLAFDDPDSGELVPAADYLSGNVRVKLNAAQTAAAADSRFGVNVAALSEVMPRDLGVDEITPQIGAVWISAADHQQFLSELLEYPGVRVRYGGGSSWEVTDAAKWSVRATSEWGTERMPAGDIFLKLLEQKPVTVWDTDPQTGARSHNATETEAAKEKAEAITERFTEWVWEEPERASRLAAEYNRRFNSLVLRDYEKDGERLALPGLATTMTPRPHQRAAVARMISEPSVGLFHEVGAGKTGEMVMGVMELRRLGMARKPVAVVPNHMLDQFAREWVQWYPQARVLAAGTEDLSKGARRDFVARVATGDWDGVVMTRTAFERLAVSPQVEADYLAREVESLREQLEIAKAAGANRTVKQVERTLISREEKVKAKLDRPRDPGVSFEETGIDYLVIDEAHAYKNLSTVSSIQSANITGSGRATDLAMKLDYLRRRNGDRIATFATATPIANSVTEAHVMTRLLRPDLLADAGVEHFDRWAATFGSTVTELEMAPAGGKYREKTRFARFQNVPEMLRMWHVFGDVKTAEDLNLPTPDLVARPDGQRLPETVLGPPTEELLEYMTSLSSRADKLSGRNGKGEDNMLKVTGDGRRAALDLRLVGADEPSAPQKLDVAADRIASIWRENAGTVYLDDSGKLSPTPGALQIVFCDQSTPKADSWNAYNTLKSLLVDRGMPPRSVRFIHEAKSDTEKARLFASARSGEIAVLIGSTEKMGVGTNVQDRAVALHHLDCPWRPADLAQRDGRILRQGNQNDEVQVIRYVTGRSFDTYSWQTVERKAKFINQVMRGRLDVREMDDIGDTALSLAETKALAADDPLILEKATADGKVARLSRLERAWHRNQAALKWRVQAASAAAAEAEDLIPALEAAASRTVPTDGDRFRIRIGDWGSSSRTDAAERLRSMILRSSVYMARRDTPIGEPIELAGHTFTVTQQRGRGGADGQYRLEIDTVPGTGWAVSAAGLGGIGVIRQMENRAAKLPELLAETRAARQEAERTAGQASRALGAPFRHIDELTAARADKQRIDQAIAERDAPERAPGNETGEAATDPGVLEEQQSRSAGGMPATVWRRRALISLSGRDAGDRYEPWAPGGAEPETPGLAGGIA